MDIVVGIALLALARPQWQWRWELIASASAAIANMLSEQFAQHEVLLQELQNDLAYVREKIGNLETSDQAAEMLEILKKIDDQGRVNHTPFPIELVDQKLEDDLDLLRKSRFFQDFDRPGFSIAFARRLVEGEISGGSPPSRSCALAWCSRVLSSSGELIRAEVYLEIAKNLGSQPELRIAEPFIQSHKGKTNIALGLLSYLSLVAWACECIGFWFILIGFGATGTPRAWAAFIYATTTLAGAVSFLPGGLLATELSMTALLMRGATGFDKATAVAATILCRLATLWFGVLVGLIALGLRRRRRPA